MSLNRSRYLDGRAVGLRVLWAVSSDMRSRSPTQDNSVLTPEALRTCSGSGQGLLVPVPDVSVALSRRRENDASGYYRFLLRESTGHSADRCPHVKILTFPREALHQCFADPISFPIAFSMQLTQRAYSQFAFRVSFVSRPHFVLISF